MSNYANLSTLQPFTIGDATYTGSDVMRAVAFGGDLKQDQAELPSWIAFWGAKAAEAKAHADAVEVSYRKARDAFHLEARINGIEDDNGKKIKATKDIAEAAWRDHEDYDGWWARQRDAERAWNAATYVYEALKEKSRLLVSMQKLWTDEMVAYHSGRQNTPGGTP